MQLLVWWEPLLWLYTYPQLSCYYGSINRLYVSKWTQIMSFSGLNLTLSIGISFMLRLCDRGLYIVFDTCVTSPFTFLSSGCPHLHLLREFYRDVDSNPRSHRWQQSALPLDHGTSALRKHLLSDFFTWNCRKTCQSWI